MKKNKKKTISPKVKSVKLSLPPVPDCPYSLSQKDTDCTVQTARIEEPEFKVGDVVGMYGEGFNDFKIINIIPSFGFYSTKYILVPTDSSLFFGSSQECSVKTIEACKPQIFLAKELSIESPKESAFYNIAHINKIKIEALEHSVSLQKTTNRLMAFAIMLLSVSFLIKTFL